MLKRILISLAVLLMTVAGEAYAQLDSTVSQALDRRLAEYFDAIEREGTGVKKGECDFLIQTCTDSLMRQHVALRVYKHYRDSKVMGDEAVAIHVFDKWFASGKVHMRSDMEMLAAKVFAEFNRLSLVGCNAPEITLYDKEGLPVALFGDNKPDRVSLLYFYDTSCASCKVQTNLLRNLLQDEGFPVDLYAVYAADDMQSWQSYVAEQLDIDSDRVKVHHLWDPGLDSDFQRKYGVIQTPRLFILSPDGIILGRGLDAYAASQILHGLFDEVELEYGGDESLALYDGLFADAYVSKEDVCAIADHIASSTLEKGDTLMFRQMSGDLMYYLTLQRGEGYREGLDYLIDEYILSRSDIWRTEDDSLKVIGMAEIYDDLMAKSTPGKLVPDLRLPGEQVTSAKVKSGEFRLRKLRGRENYIMFVTDGCSHCALEKEAAMKLVSQNRKAKVLIVNVDDVLSDNPELAGRMFDAFDLSVLPFILKTDNRGRIISRYLVLFGTMLG